MPDHVFHPLDFTGDAARDAELIREHLAGVMNELLTQRNWRKKPRRDEGAALHSYRICASAFVFD